MEPKGFGGSNTVSQAWKVPASAIVAQRKQLCMLFPTEAVMCPLPIPQVLLPRGEPGGRKEANVFGTFRMNRQTADFWFRTKGGVQPVPIRNFASFVYF